MKIVENTQDRLVIVDRPWLMTLASGAIVAGLLVGVADADNGPALRLFILACLVGLIWLLWAKVPFQRYTFDRQADWLSRERWHLWQYRRDGMAISRIEAIRQEAQWFENARATRLVLVVDGAPAALSESFGGGSLDEIETAIREWLTRPDEV